MAMIHQEAIRTEIPGTISEWYSRASVACDPFIFPESRYKTPWLDDELPGAVEKVRQWLRGNPCPDASVGDHLAAMLKSYAEMKNATVGRVMELREIIELHSKFVDRRSLPRDAAEAGCQSRSLSTPAAGDNGAPGAGVNTN